MRKLGQKMVIFFRTIRFQLKLLVLTESPNKFHWKPAEKTGVVLGKNLGQIRFHVMRKVKKLALLRGFFIFYMGNTF